MQNNISNNMSIGMQSNFLKTQNAGIKMNTQNNNNSAYYAKKGEPMYIKEMDADEDGIISFDEFKNYCDEKGISDKERIKMAEMATSYHLRQAQKKASDNVKKEGKTNNNSASNAEAVYAKRGDSKYDEVMDTNNDDKITYKEYIEYCQEHSNSPKNKTEGDAEASEESSSDFGTRKAIEAYTKQDSEYESQIEGMG